MSTYKYRSKITPALCLFFILSAPSPLLSAATGNGSAGVRTGRTDGASLKGVTKSTKTAKKRITDPERLKEIVEKSILAVEGGDEGGLELPVSGRITSTVGLRPDPIDGDIRMHNGIDIAISEGTKVRPVAAGRVAYSGMQPGYGNMVIIQHDDGMISVYAHHSRNLVKTGDRIVKDATIAYSGSTGHSTGPHLHFEAWQAGMNVTSAYLPTFAGNRIEASTHESLEKTNLRKVIMSDGTILFVEAVGRRDQ